MHRSPDEDAEALLLDNEAIPLTGILFYGPLISMPLWLVIGSVGWVMLF